ITCEKKGAPEEKLPEASLQRTSTDIQDHASGTTQSGQRHPLEDCVGKVPRSSQESPGPIRRLGQLAASAHDQQIDTAHDAEGSHEECNFFHKCDWKPDEKSIDCSQQYGQSRVAPQPHSHSFPESRLFVTDHIAELPELPPNREYF